LDIAEQGSLCVNISLKPSQSLVLVIQSDSDCPRQFRGRSRRMFSFRRKENAVQKNAPKPILIPKLRIRFADFPYLRCSTKPETANLGNLMRIAVRRERDTECRFSRAHQRRTIASKSAFHCLAAPRVRIASRAHSAHTLVLDRDDDSAWYRC